MLPSSALEGVYVCEEGLKGHLRAGAEAAELSIPSLSLEELSSVGGGGVDQERAGLVFWCRCTGT